MISKSGSSKSGCVFLVGEGGSVLPCLYLPLDLLPTTGMCNAGILPFSRSFLGAFSIKTPRDGSSVDFLDFGDLGGVLLPLLLSRIFSVLPHFLGPSGGTFSAGWMYGVLVSGGTNLFDGCM